MSGLGKGMKFGVLGSMGASFRRYHRTGIHGGKAEHVELWSVGVVRGVWDLSWV